MCIESADLNSRKDDALARQLRPYLMVLRQIEGVVISYGDSIDIPVSNMLKKLVEVEVEI